MSETATEGGYDIREMRPGEEEAVLATWNLVFAKGKTAFRPRTLEEWEWAFRGNPAGFRTFVAMKDGTCAAQYASLPKRVWIEGDERTYAEGVDSMVHPEHARGLRRPGLFVRTARAFFDHYCGPDRDLVVYGWPVREAWRIGSRELDYRAVRTQLCLAREPGDGPDEVPDEVETIGRFDEQTRWLYDRCVGEWGASIVRDDRFLSWRLREHPTRDYTTYGVRDGEGILRGYAVYRFGDWVMRDCGMLVDWLVPPGEPEVGELLHRAILARARADRAPVLVAVFPDWSRWFARFQEQGWLVHPTRYLLVGVPFHRKYADPFWLRANWWYQLIDLDLV